LANLAFAGQCNFVNVQDCTFTNRLALAKNSVNNGNNTGWTFL
jgi:hypothetical protein